MHATATQDFDQALTPAEATAWAQDGFFVRRAVFDAREVGELARAAETAAQAAEGLATAADARTYFLDGKRFVDIGHRTVQFERAQCEQAHFGTVQFEGPQTNGRTPEAVKVIEPVHDLAPALTALVHDPRLTDPMRALLQADVLSLWTDKLNLKRPGVGSGFGWHQDAPYWMHDHGDAAALPNVMVTFDDADTDNGCFCVIRGSHHEGPLPGTDDGTQLGGFYTDPKRFDLSQEVRLEAPAGSAIFFDPNLVHGSAANGSARPRRAMILTYQRGVAPSLKARRVQPVGPGHPGAR